MSATFRARARIGGRGGVSREEGRGVERKEVPILFYTLVVNGEQQEGVVGEIFFEKKRTHFPTQMNNLYIKKL